MARFEYTGTITVKLSSEDFGFEILEDLRDHKKHTEAAKAQVKKIADSLKERGLDVEDNGISLPDLAFDSDEENAKYERLLEEDNKIYQAQKEKVSKIEDEIGIKHAVWSMEDELVIENPLAFEGEITVKYEGHEVALSNPTWRDMFKAADQLITMSEDLHHVFIEGFRKIQEGEYYLATGS